MSPAARRLPGVSTLLLLGAPKQRLLSRGCEGESGWVFVGCFRMLSASDLPNASAPLHLRARSES